MIQRAMWSTQTVQLYLSVSTHARTHAHTHISQQHVSASVVKHNQKVEPQLQFCTPARIHVHRNARICIVADLSTFAIVGYDHSTHFIPRMRENANFYSSFPFLSYFILDHLQGLNALMVQNAWIDSKKSFLYVELFQTTIKGML